MSKKIDLTGQVFGRLTVIREAGSNNKGRALWLCRCKCGNEKVISSKHLINSGVLSCGCLMRERASERITKRNITHGLTHTKLYKVWGEMLRRCKNPKAANFSLYGGRGIKVCERWQTFSSFYEDMSAGYKEGLTIERIDVNGDYCFQNCKWATKEEQAQNRRNTIVVNGVSLKKFCRENGISYDSAQYRIKKGLPI